MTSLAPRCVVSLVCLLSGCGGSVTSVDSASPGAFSPSGGAGGGAGSSAGGGGGAGAVAGTGGAGGSGSAGSPGATLSPVTCTAVARHFYDGGPTDAAVDISGWKIEAVVLDASPAGLTVYPGTTTAAGDCSIPNVPDGPYLLHLTGASALDTYLATSARVLDLGYDVRGRPGLVPLAKGSTVDVTLAAVPAGSTGVRLSSGTAWFSAGKDFVGATNGTWSDTINVAVGASALLGDDLWILTHASTKVGPPGQGAMVTRATGAAHVAQVEIDAVSSSVMATIAPVPTKAYAFAMDGNAIHAHLDMLGAAPKDAFASVTILANIGSSAMGEPLVSQQLDLTNPLPVAAGTFAYPFAAPWEIGVSVTIDDALSIDYGAASPALISTTLRAGVDGLPTDGSVVPFSLGWPLAPTVDGQAGPGVFLATSKSPTIAWSPPAFGVPSGYRVLLRTVVGDAGTSFWTTSTSIRIPPGVLVSGKAYTATVEAFKSEAAVDIHPFRLPALRTIASAPIGVLLP